MEKNREQSTTSAAELQDKWFGKKVKVKNDEGKFDSGWEVHGATITPEPSLMLIKTNKFDRIEKSDTVPLNRIEEE